ncbi:hypothetical protein CTAM01_09413 [Colletotrichum tamarilloi]|uniref:Uncharacterized protein n=1 Tax=Colletotrichum tamarilloi TaxID=1209934 RepID=A0ABQ9R368_9PEZI|nr:uncharacterized protein CTAM01_09413 [Colletotrichum tamarilloi]KAK1493269.1 hypothetical protein CTAM01_09413 [Colletotrichum tamarilloi]
MNEGFPGLTRDAVEVVEEGNTRFMSHEGGQYTSDPDGKAARTTSSGTGESLDRKISVHHLGEQPYTDSMER